MAAVILAVALAACTGTVVDLSSPSGLGTDYVQGAVYVLRHDRYLDTPQGWPAARLVIVPSPNSYSYVDAPRSTDEYRANPGRWPKVRGILPAGTRVRLERIEHHEYPALEDWYEIHGVIVNGDFRGTEVNLAFISSGVPGSRMWRINPEELSLETADGPDPIQ